MKKLFSNRLRFFDSKVAKQDLEIKSQIFLDTQENSILTFFDSSPIPTLLVNNSGFVKRSNQAFVNLMGSKKYAEPGWNLEQIVKKTQHDILKEAFANTLKNNIKNKPVEIKLIHRQLITYMFMTKIILEDKEYFTVHFIDITEQKNLERNFAHSQKMQALGQLAGGIAHDFNNLLTGMLGFTDLLLVKHFEGDPSFAGLIQIKKNINRAINLVRQLLAFSKKQVQEIQSINVNEVLSELAHLINRLIDDNISLEMKYAPNLTEIKFDKGQLEQIIINLAVNARDAMPNGGTLTIATENISKEVFEQMHKTMITPCENNCSCSDNYVLISVQDTGAGIPKKYLNKIFEPFFSTKKIGTGTGLGLSTVYGIIKHSNGCLFVETGENIGTKFYVLLKIDGHTKKETKKLATKKEEQDQAISSNLSETRDTILIVEDEEAVRTVSTYALETKGYNVISVENGVEALEILNKESQRIDLVITDLLMPVVGGVELLENIRKEHPDLKVIFISGYEDHPLLGEIIDNKKVHFLAKPFSIKELETKVGHVLKL